MVRPILQVDEWGGLVAQSIATSVREWEMKLWTPKGDPELRNCFGEEAVTNLGGWPETGRQEIKRASFLNREKDWNLKIMAARRIMAVIIYQDGKRVNFLC
jgi:hypothetical protein